MSVLFPNEQQIPLHDVIELTGEGIFEGFENELQNTPMGASQTIRDYDFKQAGANGRIVLAKPLRGGNMWACDVTSGSPMQGQWVEKAQYDPSTGSIIDPQANQQAGSVTTGACQACGTFGHTGKFCNQCGGPLTQVAAGTVSSAANPLLPPGAMQVSPIPVTPIAGQAQPGQTPQAGAGHMPPPAHVNPHRMEGRPSKEVVIPEGMSKAKSTGFEDALDALLAQNDD